MTDEELYQSDPLSLIYNGIVTGIIADDFIKSLSDNAVVVLDFLPMPNLPEITNPSSPMRDRPRVSLMAESVTWGANNSCTGRLDYTINIVIHGQHTRSILFNPLVYHFMRVIRKLDTFLRPILFQGKPLSSISKVGSATFEHDDEKLQWTCTIPIEIQLYI
jgi:hypothetical protein